MSHSVEPKGIRAVRSQIREALQELANRRPVFHSEADFQHEFAVQLTRLNPLAEIRLERPFRIPGERTVNLDLLMTVEGVRCAMELKFVTAKLETTISGESFALRAQAAQDLRRYDILKDVVRVERLISANLVDLGFSITLSNDPTLWRESLDPNTVDAAFRLHHGRLIEGELLWDANASAGTIRSREAPLRLTGNYTLEWTRYSEVPETTRSGDFRTLIVEIVS